MGLVDEYLCRKWRGGEDLYDLFLKYGVVEEVGLCGGVICGFFFL